MRSFILIPALISSFCWISGSQTLTAEPGEEILLSCPNISNAPCHTEWFRVVNGTQPSCVSSLYDSGGVAYYCQGFGNGKFSMSSNNITVFLKIKQVDLSDSGLYMCGFYKDRHTLFTTAIKLTVHDSTIDEQNMKTANPGQQTDPETNWSSIILGVVAGLLMIIIIVLTLKIRKLQTEIGNGQQTERSQTSNSDNLNYAAVKFQAKVKRSHRPAPEISPHVVYASTR